MLAVLLISIPLLSANFCKTPWLNRCHITVFRRGGEVEVCSEKLCCKGSMEMEKLRFRIHPYFCLNFLD